MSDIALTPVGILPQEDDAWLIVRTLGVGSLKALKRRETIVIFEEGHRPRFTSLPLSQLYRLDTTARQVWNIGWIKWAVAPLGAILLGGCVFLPVQLAFHILAFSLFACVPWMAIGTVVGWGRGKRWGRRAWWFFWRKDGGLYPIRCRTLLQDYLSHDGKEGPMVYRADFLYARLKMHNLRRWQIKKRMSRSRERLLASVSVMSLIIMVILMIFTAVIFMGE